MPQECSRNSRSGRTWRTILLALHGRYNARRLRLVQRGATHFDFVFEPLFEGAARIAVRDVDVSLMTPALADWMKADPGVERIALTDQLAAADYPNGFYRPMGIGVPPFFQSYDALRGEPPERGTYYSVLLGPEDRWLDHHRIAVDGAVLFRDRDDGDLLHLYLLSFERHSLITHLAIPLGAREHHGGSP